jgi:hypothetical protein
MLQPPMKGSTPTTLRLIDATMTTKAGDVYPVSLRATVSEDRTVARLELIDALPNGDYVLEYFYGKPFHGEARVVNSSLEVL